MKVRISVWIDATECFETLGDQQLAYKQSSNHKQSQMNVIYL